MKFEKFLKSVGTHGIVIERNEAEKWLLCDGVGMIIPRGVDNILGTSKHYNAGSTLDFLANAELDDPLVLKEAVLFDATGNAGAIYRVFETYLGDRVGIINADYGFIEKKDLLGYAEIEGVDENGEEPIVAKYILVYDRNKKLQGYITGSDKF